MAKHRPSLEAFAQSAAPGAITVATTTDNVVELVQPAMAAARKDRPHTTLYLSKKVQRVIKEIALQYDRKPHDLYLEGINLMLTQYGRPSIQDISKD
jgi:hypothetical protein